MLAWHDPNFRVNFEGGMDMIEQGAPPGSIDFLAESSLSHHDRRKNLHLATRGSLVSTLFSRTFGCGPQSA
jgi:hypothetical protein